MSRSGLTYRTFGTGKHVGFYLIKLQRDRHFSEKQYAMTPCLALICIWKAVSSNLGPETDCLDFVVFSAVSAGEIVGQDYNLSLGY